MPEGPTRIELLELDIDLRLTETGDIYVIEVNAVPGWRALAPVTGVDVPVEMLRFLADEYRRR